MTLQQIQRKKNLSVISVCNLSVTTYADLIPTIILTAKNEIFCQGLVGHRIIEPLDHGLKERFGSDETLKPMQF